MSALVRGLGAGLGAVVVLLVVLLVERHQYAAAGSHARVETASEVPKVTAEKCRRCHDRAFAQRAAVQRATMDTSDCATCHDAPSPRVRRAGLTVLPSAAHAAGPAGEAAKSNSPDLVVIPAGSFWMGSDDRHPEEGPRRRVTVPSFSIDRYEVTNTQYRAHLDAIGAKTTEVWNDGTFPLDRANHPVANVSWFEAKAYCEWRGARLPTEAEWEKAARGTDGRTYPWGDQMDPKLANIAESHIGHTLPVGAFPEGRSPYGLYDMAGNVWEWTEDWFKAYPGNREPDENYGERYRVARGGGWKVCTFYGCGSHAPTFNRAFFNPVSRNETFGFRCARSAQ